MRNALKNAHLIGLTCGAVGILLRLWMLLGGTDDRDLYPADHPAWILLCLVSLCAVIFFFLLSRHTEPRRSYKNNFPASGLGAAGYLAAATGIAVSGFAHFGDFLGNLTGIAAILSALALIFGGWQRLQGNRTTFLSHALPCLYLVLRVFTMGRILGAEPETSRYLFSFLATLASLLACYELWGFDVGLGHRNNSIFWSLTAAYLCLAAMPGDSDRLAYLGLALWFLSNLCNLKPLRRVKKAAPAEPQPELLPQEDPLPAPAEEPLPPEPGIESAHAPGDMDTDALIAWLMEDLDEPQ